MTIRTIRFALPWLLAFAVACGDDTDHGTAPVVVVKHVAKAVEAAPTTWGSVGIDVTGGYGSALVADVNDTSVFWLLTDRGPTVTTPIANQVVFALPSFTPTIAKYQLVGDSLQRVTTIPLKNAAGVNLTGRPNPPGVGGTGEVAVNTGGIAVGTDPDGIDSEGLAVAPDGTFWVADEYGPSFVHFDANGRTIERISPFSGGTRALPAVFAFRRPNRSMKGLAITSDGNTLMGAMESPLDNPTATLGRKSNVVRLLTYNIATGLSQTFVYELDAVGNFVTDIQALTAKTFLVIETDAGQATGSSALTTKRVYKINLALAGDVGDPLNGLNGRTYNGRTLEELSPAERGPQGIVPVTKTLVYDLQTLPGGYPHDKPEGVSIIGNDLLVVANDDDFGVMDGGASNFVAKILPATGLRDRLTLYFIRLGAPVR